MRHPLRSIVLASLTLSMIACNEEPPAPSAAASSTTATTVAPAANPLPAPVPSPSPAPVVEAPPTEIAAQHILIAYKGAKGAPKAVKRSKAEARKRAEEVLEKLKGGADFTALVKEFSEDPGSVDRLGSLGKFTKDKMVKPFSEAAFALKVNEVSDIVETPFGFHIIKRNQ